MVLHQEVRPSQRMRPVRVARRDGEYQRSGQRILRGAAKAERYFPKVTPDRSSPAFADYLLDIAIHYPEADTIHLVLDNLNSHTRKAVVERFGEKAGNWLWERFTMHYTPKHGSWLNQAEIAISLLSRQCLGQRRIGDRVLSPARNPGLESSHESFPHSHPVELYSQKARHTFDYIITRSRY